MKKLFFITALALTANMATAQTNDRGGIKALTLELTQVMSF